MTVWNIYRNDIPYTGGSYDPRGRNAWYQIKERLVENGWTILGTGNGSSSFDVAGADLWTSAGAMSQGCWLWIKNVEDVECVLWFQDTYNWWLWASFDGFNTTGVSASSPPGNSSPPADLCNPGADGNNDLSPYVDCYATLLVNETSFLTFGRTGSAYRGVPSMCFVKLDVRDQTDPYPYWFRVWGYNSYGTSYKAWLAVRMEDTRANNRGRHPGGNVYQYSAAKYQCPNSNMMDSMPDDPVTGDPVMHNVWVCCYDNQHVRGKIPDVYRVSELKADGAHLHDDAFVVCSDYCFPWESTDTLWGT